MERKAIPMEELIQILQLQLQQGGKAYLTVTGFSMFPMLTPLRDRVLLVPYDGKLRCGDVILYRRDNGRYVLHRIVKLAQPLICCGDNQWEIEQVQPSQVIAVVSAFVRNGKHFNVNDRDYRRYTWFAVRLFPLRRPYIAIRRLLGKIRRKLQQHKRT